MNRSFAFEIRLLFPEYFLEYFRCAGERVAADCAFFLGDHHKESVECFLGNECREIGIYFLLKGDFIIRIYDVPQYLVASTFSRDALMMGVNFSIKLADVVRLRKVVAALVSPLMIFIASVTGHLFNSIDEDIFGGLGGIFGGSIH
jgi:hypothetical protein